MSKQAGYEQLHAEVPSAAQEYGFAARLPQAGGASAAKGAGHGDGEARGAGGEHMAYPAAAYAGAPASVTGYPAVMSTTPMAGPVGMVAVNPLGKKQARRMGYAAGGCRRCHGCRRRRVGPVGALVGLVRSALRSSQGPR